MGFLVPTSGVDYERLKHKEQRAHWNWRHNHEEHEEREHMEHQ